MGANIFKNLFALIRHIVGGRAGAYEQVLRDARDEALRELKAKAHARGVNAIVGVDLDYGAVGSGKSMMMVSASGTAVTIGPQSACAKPRWANCPSCNHMQPVGWAICPSTL